MECRSRRLLAVSTRKESIWFVHSLQSQSHGFNPALNLFERFFLDRAKMLGNTVCMPFMNQQRTCESVAYLRNFHKCCCNWWQHFTRYYSNVIIRLIECRFFVFQIAICFQSSCVVWMNRFRSIEFSTKTERWFWFCWEKSNVNHSKLSFCSEIMVFAFVQSLV